MEISKPEEIVEIARYVCWTFSLGRPADWSIMLQPGQFTADILNALQMADGTNRPRLAAAYPLHAMLVKAVQDDQADIVRYLAAYRPTSVI